MLTLLVEFLVLVPCVLTPVTVVNGLFDTDPCVPEGTVYRVAASIVAGCLGALFGAVVIAACITLGGL
jgi:hypothetical protein